MIEAENWNIITTVLIIVGFGFSMLLWGIFLYFLFISAFGWIKRKEIAPSNFLASKRFAILIAAHNEEKVIASAIKSVKKVKYPTNLFDIFVIADNCNDDTAKIAKAEGVFVYERFDSELKGKGYALDWMFNNLFEMENKYDGMCVLDADNLVSVNFLMEMNKHLCLGHEAIQGYIDSKNPSDTWISGNNSIAFWISNRLIQLPRYYMGLSCILGGTGFVVSAKLIKELGWGATCLAEDLEFSLKMILKGKKVYWAHDAIVYDEKPLKIKQSWIQRKRWMQGHFNCAGRFLKPLFIRAITKKDVIAMDMCIYLTQPIIVAVNGIGMIGSFAYLLLTTMAKGYSLTTLMYAAITLGFLYVSGIFVFMEGKLTSKAFKHLILMPLYNLTWVPIIIQGFIGRNKNVWTHTLHTRDIEIDDLKTNK